CISRQQWWGHRIPAYDCTDCGKTTVSREPVKICPHCNSERIEQDPDTLDTWFSSALWPFSTLGWPKKTPELDYFYPTDVLVTGYDIIFFWVIRMVFSGVEQTGKCPFHHVLIHGLVRDDQGRKMSKSLGNGIDPLEVIDKYGADALRLTLVTGNAPGNDMRFYWSQVEASRNFANKIWNASRFIMMNEPEEGIKTPSMEDLKPADCWMLSRINTVTREITENMDKYELGIAVSKIHDFLWDEFCDWYIEIVKARLGNREADPVSADAALWTLKKVLADALKLLHPYMPFITEEIYCTLLPEEETIMTSAWPVYDPAMDFPEDEALITQYIELIRGIRNIRTKMNVPASTKSDLFIVVNSDKAEADYNTICTTLTAIMKMAFAKDIKVQRDKTGISEDAVSVVTSTATVFIPLEELVDKEKEIARLQAESKKMDGEIKRCEGMLNNPKFVSKAPEAKVNAEKEKLATYKAMKEKLEEQLRAYGV
ncbi:MAG: class I tRNA ligase family protein, partial [Lachnospiraceae bacterium]|nr:class I tRNA ligase family protein [Candidatus Equihabitans merdae]